MSLKAWQQLARAFPLNQGLFAPSGTLKASGESFSLARVTSMRPTNKSTKLTLEAEVSLDSQRRKVSSKQHNQEVLSRKKVLPCLSLNQILFIKLAQVSLLFLLHSVVAINLCRPTMTTLPSSAVIRATNTRLSSMDGLRALQLIGCTSWLRICFDIVAVASSSWITPTTPSCRNISRWWGSLTRFRTFCSRNCISSRLKASIRKTCSCTASALVLS